MEKEQNNWMINQVFYIILLPSGRLQAEATRKMMQDFSNIFSTISPMLKTLFSKLPQKCLIYNKSLSKTK